MDAVLQVEDLHISFPVHGGTLHAVRGVSFSIARGETLCIVGESGCGKSLTAMSLLRLLPRNASVKARQLSLEGEDLLGASENRLEELRGDRIAMVFQEPMTSLNPAYTIGTQLGEVLERHRTADRSTAGRRSIELLEKVGIAGAKERLSQYPHQLSGGLRQRVMIAMALMCNPAVLVADEPTTALDVTIQAQILRLLAQLKQDFSLGLLLISHDLGVVANVADRVAVMYAGRIVEAGSVTQVLRDPRHPYTRGLLEALPISGSGKKRLGSIPGTVPSLIGESTGCAFRSRCKFAQEICAQSPISVSEDGHAVECWLATPRQVDAVST